MNALVMVWMAAVPVPLQQQAVDARLPVGQRVAAVEALTAVPKAEDFAALRPLNLAEEPALLAAYLRFLAVVPEPESVAVARALYARTADLKMRALAVAAVQPALAPPDDLVPFFFGVLTQETAPETEPIHLVALKKLTELNTDAAALAVLRYEPLSEPTMVAKLDALHALRAHVPAKIAAFARQHARSPRPKVAEKANALLTVMKARR